MYGTCIFSTSKFIDFYKFAVLTYINQRIIYRNNYVDLVYNVR